MKRWWAALLLLGPGSAFAHAEFQIWIQKSSGRSVNCALCHANSDGPEGLRPGQIGALDPDERGRLDKARLAFEPGMAVDSPILNSFGNQLLGAVGKKKLAVLKEHPEMLPGLVEDSDFDGDGISDGQELRDGTHPGDALHGSPARLLAVNLVRHRFHLLMLALATALGVYGIRNFLLWFAIHARRGLERSEEP